MLPLLYSSTSSSLYPSVLDSLLPRFSACGAARVAALSMVPEKLMWLTLCSTRQYLQILDISSCCGDSLTLLLVSTFLLDFSLVSSSLTPAHVLLASLPEGGGKDLLSACKKALQ